MGLGVPIPNTQDGCRAINVSGVLETACARDRLIAIAEVVAMRASHVILVVVLIAGTALDASAQSRRVAPRAGPIGGMASPPPPSVPRIQQPPYGSQYDHVPYGSEQYGSPVIGSVPVALMPDGRIYADFGYGYEPVIRSCAAATSAIQVSPAPQYSPPAYTTPTYTLPSYAPPTHQQPSGMQSMSSPTAYGQRSAMRLRTSANPVIPSCWVTDAYGRVVVVRQ